MLNGHITEELDRFRRSAGRAFYALQIDASWGAGKTHFIRAYLERTCGPFEGLGEAGPEPHHVLVSLFGATAVADLESQVAAQLFTGREQIAGRLTSFVVTAAASYVNLGQRAQEELDRQGLRLLSDRLTRLREGGGIIVFDDVERARMPLRDALGYINRFVEHEGFKVVLVTNEAALAREDASVGDKVNLKDLRLFKEKLVGRTLALSPEPDEAYYVFVATMANEDARRLATQHREAAIGLFRASSRNNLRSLRMGLEGFDRLVPVFDRVWLERGEAMREVLLGCLLVAIEHAGGADPEAVANPTKGRFKGLFGLRQEHDPTPVEAEARRILTTYQDQLAVSGPPIPFPMLVALVAQGRLVADEVREVMAQSPLVVGSQNAPPWRVLIEI